jgi:hypothetical protein
MSVLGFILQCFPILHSGRFIAILGKLLVAVLNTVAILFPASGFLLVMGCLVTKCSLRSFLLLAGIAYVAIPSRQ